MSFDPAKLAAVLLVLFSALPQWAGAADLQVRGAWARSTPPGAQVGAVYFSIANRGAHEDQLLSLSTGVAGSVEMHETRLLKGVMQMRQVSSIRCPPGATVQVEPGGLHVMLLGLKQPLMDGAQFDLTLRFLAAGAVVVHVAVRDEI